MKKIFRFLRTHTLIAAIVGVLTIASVLITGYFCYRLDEYYTYKKGIEINMAETGQVGDFVGGVVGTIISFIAIILVFITYINQREANEKDKIENRFFKLIQIHIDNVNAMKYTNPYERKITKDS